MDSKLNTGLLIDGNESKKNRNEYEFFIGQDKTNNRKTYFFILIKIEPFQFITIFYYHTAMAVDPRHKQQVYHSLFGYKQKLREYVSQQIDLSIYIDENEDLMHPNAYQEIEQMLISLQQGNGELCYQHTAGKGKHVFIDSRWKLGNWCLY